MVDEVVSGIVALTLPGVDGLAARLVGWGAKNGLILAARHHHLMLGNLHPLHVATSGARRVLTGRRRNRVARFVRVLVGQIRQRGAVGLRPIRFQFRHTRKRHHPRRLGLQRHGFDGTRRIVVIHPLRVDHPAHMAAPVNLVVNLHFLADRPDNRDVFAQPRAFIGDLVANQEPPRDALADRLALGQHVGREHRIIGHAIGQIALPQRGAVAHQIELVSLLLAREPLAHANVILVVPYVVGVQRGAGEAILVFRIFGLGLVARHVIEHEGEPGI